MRRKSNGNFRNCKHLACCALLALPAAALSAQDENRGERPVGAGRVAGLSVTVTSGPGLVNGTDVEFDVQMTTQRATWLGPTEERGGGRPTLTNTTTSYSGSGGLGNMNLRYYYQGTGSVPFGGGASASRGTSYTFFAGTNYQTTGYYGAQGTLLAVTQTGTEYIEGELPAIDYGDGNTLEETSLSYLSRTQQTVTTSNRGGGPGQTRLTTTRWRSSFSHSYGSPGSYEIVAASRCCADGRSRRPSRGGGVIEPYTGEVVYAQTPSQIRYSGQFYARTQFTNGYATSVYTWNGSDASNRGGYELGSGSFVRDFSESGYFSDANGDSDRRPHQVVNGASVGSILAIPTASGFALGVLAILLASVGVLLVRKG